MNIAEENRAARSLIGAPRVAAGPEYAAAVNLALVHARACLSLPTVLPIVWVSKLGGHSAETWWFDGGDVEVRFNAGADVAPREMARVALHEFVHVSEGGGQPRGGHWAAEDRANDFAAFVMREWATAFARLDGRRPSRRR